MRLSSIKVGGRCVIALRSGRDLVDLSAADHGLPGELALLLEQWPTVGERLSELALAPPSAALVHETDIEWLPPIPRPGKLLCLGLNYADHAAESRYEKPAWPVLFARFASSLIGHRAPLVAPSVSPQFDYEAELAVIIGRHGRAVPPDRALHLVAGYSIFNDGSVRDYQFKSHQWTADKNFDGTGAFGPELATADELPSGAKGLRIATKLNGEIVQDANTSDMIFDVAETIALVSETMSLERAR